MSYTKHTWSDGELVTAAKMNNIENGIEEASSGGGVLVVHMNTESGVLDKTWNEIDAVDVAVIVFRIDGANFREFVTITEYQNGSYLVNTVNDGAGASYAADSADGYPVHQ